MVEEVKQEEVVAPAEEAAPFEPTSEKEAETTEQV